MSGGIQDLVSWLVDTGHDLVTAAWLWPVILPMLTLTGLLRAWYCRRSSRAGTPCSQLIIQITTIGNHATVNWIIQQIRNYNLTLPYSIWVVIEEGTAATYPLADEIVIVPASFTCQARNKARALEYSRMQRASRDLSTASIRLMFLDDDSLPTEAYIVAGYNSRWDVCQGFTAPRLGYGRLLSHMDDLRALNCITFCSVFQGFGHPMHVHGEGLCVRGSVEAAVGWNYPIFASEDLVFGQMAAYYGFTWGFFWECIQITSPWTWRDLVTQRRRWLWGNIHAIRNVLPLRARILIVSKWLFGISIFVISSTAIVLTGLGGHPAGLGIATHFWVALGIWLAMFGVSGIISSYATGRSRLWRSGQMMAAMMLAWVTATVTVGLLIISAWRGNPRRFDVIRKTRLVSVLEPPTDTTP